jgi:hypothetical protein
MIAFDCLDPAVAVRDPYLCQTAFSVHDKVPVPVDRLDWMGSVFLYLMVYLDNLPFVKPPNECV